MGWSSKNLPRSLPFWPSGVGLPGIPYKSRGRTLKVKMTLCHCSTSSLLSRTPKQILWKLGIRTFSPQTHLFLHWRRWWAWVECEFELGGSDVSVVRKAVFWGHGKLDIMGIPQPAESRSRAYILHGPLFQHLNIQCSGCSRNCLPAVQWCSFPWLVWCFRKCGVGAEGGRKDKTYQGPDA